MVIKIKTLIGRPSPKRILRPRTSALNAARKLGQAEKVPPNRVQVDAPLDGKMKVLGAENMGDNL